MLVLGEKILWGTVGQGLGLGMLGLGFRIFSLAMALWCSGWALGIFFVGLGLRNIFCRHATCHGGEVWSGLSGFGSKGVICSAE